LNTKWIISTNGKQATFKLIELTSLGRNTISVSWRKLKTEQNEK
jgi:hypothetical protein